MPPGKSSQMLLSPKRDLYGKSTHQQIFCVVALTFPMISCEALFEYGICLLTVSRDPSSNYELSAQDVRSLWEGMCSLSEHITIWPHPADLLRHGNKLAYIKHLKEIAQEITHTRYPDIFLVEDPLSLVGIKSEEMILMRNYRSSHEGIIITGDASFDALLKEDVALSQEQYGYFEDWIKPQWFSMPHSMEFTAFGELRAFFIGGHLIYVMSDIEMEGRRLSWVENAILINPLSIVK